jgi:hypothetical protein
VLIPRGMRWPDVLTTCCLRSAGGGGGLVRAQVALARVGVAPAALRRAREALMLGAAFS